MTDRISRPELWATLKDALERHGISHQEFDRLLDQYDEGRRGDVSQELAAFEAITAAEYTEAQILVKGMAPKDRAVCEFWAGELASLVSHVQMTEERFTS
jgi:hypothetical protein